MRGNVETCRWPEEFAERARLHSAGLACLLLVEPGSEPPATSSAIEDWAWSDASSKEITVRIKSLMAASLSFVSMPTISEDGVVEYRGQRNVLPPVEARLARELIANFGSVVSRDQLSRGAWGANSPGRNALDVHILRIRRRLEPLMLQVTTVRSRGYLLDAVPGD